jgi:geranylgeranyl diphosphate synthase type I
MTASIRFPAGHSAYASWAADCFESRIRPLIESMRVEILPGVDAGEWLDTCAPGPSAETRARLFPGSFFLLWTEALAGAEEASRGAEPVAAALELLHNASLVHDDLLDEHALRKGQPTLYARHGGPFALLGGDGLCAASLLALARAPGERLAGSLRLLGRAAQEVVAGQLLDEPVCWARVRDVERAEHWLRVCRGKLALGNVAGPLGAFWAGRESLEETLRQLLEDYSVVSQVINDFGDLLGFSGYQTTAPSLRDSGEEARRKPTLPLIWAGRENASEVEDVDALLRRAEGEIARRKELALRRLGQLPLSESARPLLFDFFESPTLPARRDSETP